MSLHNHPERRKSRLVFLTASTAIHLMVLAGVSLLLFPVPLDDKTEPPISVTLDLNKYEKAPPIKTVKPPVEDMQTLTVYVDDRVNPLILSDHRDDDQDKGSTSSAQKDHSRLPASLAIINPQLIQRITAELFDDSEDTIGIFTTHNLTSTVHAIDAFMDNRSAIAGMTKVAFNYAGGLRVCAEYSDPNPLDAFSNGFWRVMSMPC